MGLKAALIGLAFLGTPALAEWKVESFKDRMTEKTVKYATLPAKTADRGISAQLELTCGGLDDGRALALHWRLQSRLVDRRIFGSMNERCGRLLH